MDGALVFSNATLFVFRIFTIDKAIIGAERMNEVYCSQGTHNMHTEVQNTLPIGTFFYIALQRLTKRDTRVT